MNYKIITDEDRLREFIDWLPDLEEGEVFYCALFAKKKYAPEIIDSSDRKKLKRFLATKKTLFNKIQHLEVKEGTYYLRGKQVPQHSLVVYVNPNPRSLTKIVKKAAKHFIDLIDNKGYNPMNEVLSLIQNTPSRKLYHDFDIDTFSKEYNIIDLCNALNNFIGKDSYKVLDTRGGFHILIEYNKIPDSIKKSWYLIVKQMIQRYFPSDLDRSGDMMMSVPGCIQGDYEPKFLN